MKKILFFLIVMAICASSMAQVVYVESVGASNSDRGIVRENDIAYFEERGQGYFAYIPSLGALTYYRAKIPEKWRILDFHVMDGIVYFCGYNTLNTTALLGHFAISNLIAGSASYQIFYDNNIGNYLTVLNRIAIAKDKQTGTLSVMAIGRNDNTDPERNGSNRVVYLDNYYSGTPGCIFNTQLDDDPGRYWDVVTTESFFVMVGTRTFPTNTMTLRKVHRGTSNAAFLSIFNQCYYYPCDYRFYSGIRATALNGDYIAASSYYDYGSTIDGKLQLFTINTVTSQMEYNRRFIGLVFDYGDFTIPREIAYQPATKRVMVLGNILTDSTSSFILDMDPYSSSAIDVPNLYFKYKRNNNIPPAKLFTSLIPAASDVMKVACGASWMLLDQTILPPMEKTDGCIGCFTTDIFLYSSDTNTSKSSGEVFNFNRSMVSVNKEISPWSLTNDCSHDTLSLIPHSKNNYIKETDK